MKKNLQSLIELKQTKTVFQSRKYRKANKNKYYNDQQRKRETKPVFLSQLFYNAKTRSEKKNIEFDLTKEFLEELLDFSEMKCSVTGLEMNLECHSRKKANPFKCSIDRIDSSKGYLQDNVRFVCWAVNQMKADRTDEEFKFWVESIYKAISSQA